jgi:hypothetical protein
MSQFEFIFSLYSLLLGFSLVELLGGLGRALKSRLQVPDEQRSLADASQTTAPLMQIGFLTPLLGVFVMLDLLSFWAAAWTVRDIISVNGGSLMGVMLFASAYYLAAHLVYPDQLCKTDDLDQHYFRVRKIVFGVLIVLLVVQLLFYATQPTLAQRLANPTSISATAILVLLMATAFFAKSKALNIAILLALILRYTLAYVL